MKVYNIAFLFEPENSAFDSLIDSPMVLKLRSDIGLCRTNVVLYDGETTFQFWEFEDESL